MKKTRRILSVLLIVVLLVTISVIPASAAEYPWTSFFAQFQVLRPGCRNTYAGFTIPLQTFLGYYSESWREDIEGAGGKDGWYGDVTATCVGEYQVAKGLSSDNVCGRYTWIAIAQDLDLETYPAVYILSYDNGYIYNVSKNFPLEFRYYYYQYGEIYRSDPFFTISSPTSV